LCSRCCPLEKTLLPLSEQESGRSLHNKGARLFWTIRQLSLKHYTKSFIVFVLSCDLRCFIVFLGFSKKLRISLLKSTFYSTFQHQNICCTTTVVLLFRKVELSYYAETYRSLVQKGAVVFSLRGSNDYTILLIWSTVLCSSLQYYPVPDGLYTEREGLFFIWSIELSTLKVSQVSYSVED
jgi:hypothetical protein